MTGVAQRYVKDDDTGSAMTLVRGLITNGYGVELWNGDARAFLRAVLKQWTEQHAPLAGHWFDLGAWMADSLTQWDDSAFYHGSARDPSKFYIMAGASSRVSKVAIGDTLQLLSDAHPRLPHAFYGWMNAGLAEVIWPFDWTTRWFDRETKLEAPAALAQPLSLAEQLVTDEEIEQLIRHMPRRVQDLMNAAREVRDSANQINHPRFDWSDGLDCQWGDPVPGIVFTNTENDETSGQFDELMQEFQESEYPPGPCFIVELDVNDPATFAASVNAFCQACATLERAAFVLDMIANEGELPLARVLT